VVDRLLASFWAWMMLALAFDIFSDYEVDSPLLDFSQLPRESVLSRAWFVGFILMEKRLFSLFKTKLFCLRALS